MAHPPILPHPAHTVVRQVCEPQSHSRAVPSLDTDTTLRPRSMMAVSLIADTEKAIVVGHQNTFIND